VTERGNAKLIESASCRNRTKSSWLPKAVATRDGKLLLQDGHLAAQALDLQFFRLQSSLEVEGVGPVADPLGRISAVAVDRIHVKAVGIESARTFIAVTLIPGIRGNLSRIGPLSLGR